MLMMTGAGGTVAKYFSQKEQVAYLRSRLTAPLRGEQL
jgi:hypothetical protein